MNTYPNSQLSRNTLPDLPLWLAARETDLRRLPLPARKIAARYGLDGSTARLIAMLAGIGSEAGR